MEPDLDAQMNPCSRRCFVVAVFHLYVSFLLVCRALNDTCLCVSDACLPSPNIVCLVCPKYVFVCVVVVLCMKVILRLKDLHAYGKICESVHKTASANKICKRKRSFAKV